MYEENKNSLIKTTDTRLPKFVEDAYESIEKMQAFAQLLLDSKLVPYHFYEQLPDKKPDFTKGKTSAVVAVLIQGYQLQLPPLTALQHMIPVNGLLSIKGDLAKSMIFNSGKLKPGSWVEEETGSIDNEDMVVKISATRIDNGQTLTRSFSVAQAKRAGLWITAQQVSGQDGWKYKSSAWYKFPARMLNYRALGFLARDMFPDILAGIYTTEEAIDMPVDQTVVIDQGNGVTLQIQDKEFTQGRAAKMTERAVSKIADKLNPKSFVPVDPKTEQNKVIIAGVESPFIPQHGSVEYFGSEVTRINGELTNTNVPADISGEPTDDALTIEVMSKMETEDLLKIINDNADMSEALMAIPGKNTNRKLREIIDAYNHGALHMLVPKEEKKALEDDQATTDDTTQEEGIPTQADQVPVNKDFDKQTKQVPVNKVDDLFAPTTKELTRFDIAIPEFDKGQERSFGPVKQLYQALNGINPQINNERFLELQALIPEFTRFKNKEDFCKYATIGEVHQLLEKNL